ncbi:hypothetical protein Tsubulata_003954 [Turnera subulata]|uniref:Uncharacterized protein n=1 Tax=Turnera subulata TaxID=218843 RepID=A0A9Q0JNY3_9ROSI|nr:hypothetical protein Tsubulata_003954 [Turnera subulata]
MIVKAKLMEMNEPKNAEFNQRQRDMSPECYPMSSGDGPHSYSRNSTIQKKGLEAAKEPVSKAIQDMFEFNNLKICGSSKTLCIADFGCSVGPNTFIATQNITKAVQLKYISQHHQNHLPPLEFQVFFNDHINNDFNTLFRNLHSPLEFFAAGVPGDFRNRLFPKESLHLGHSSYALHWLSRVPEEVVDVNSPAWNKDNIHCTGLSKEVSKAYSGQFQKDLDNFLNARAQELVGGGLMILIIPGLPDGSLSYQTRGSMNYDLLGSCLVDMSKLGLISEEKVKTFSLPVYHPTRKELEALLERNTYFRVERISWLPRHTNSPPSAQSITSFMRATMEREVASKDHGPECVSYPMTSGDGPHSYSQNSTLQKKGLESVKELVNTAIQDTLEFNNLSSCETPKTFCIADFGCSTGPNTFTAMQNIMEAVQAKYNSRNHNHPPLDFQVFFNDHINNDFNTLFRNLPSPLEFYAAGVPGDFHNRLFPKASLNIGHSFFALHWLSRAPEEVMDVNSPAWNKDSIHCTGFSKEVADAYSTQFQKDMDSFLNARAQELVGGGLMILMILGLPDGLLCSQTSVGASYDILGSCLTDMAKLGLISEDKVRAFNLPIYHTTSKELKALLERYTFFSVERIDWQPSYDKNTPLNVQSYTSSVRAFMEELIKQHFGEEIIDSVFERFAEKLAANYLDFLDKHIPAKKGVENAKEMVNKAIQDFLEFNNLNICGNGPKTFCIADFGCSTGPNTFFAVQNIIEAVRLKHPSSEFQVFFNDHPNNDFNTLFRRNLPSPREFFAAGVPGDFHTRLFPKASLHLGHRRKRDVTDRSVPEEVMDVNSPAWNEDSIYCTGYSEEVAKAYSTQFQKDMDNFLNARAQELVGGGLMVLILPGLPDGLLCSQIHLGLGYDHLGSCLKDMAKLGLISQEKVKAFNLPIYHPTSKELEVLLERNTYFRVERIDYLPSNITGTLSVQSVISFMRAIMEELIKQHFGEEILDYVFERLAEKLSADYHNYVKKEMSVGLISEDKVRAFSLPIYHPTSKELKSLLERNTFSVSIYTSSMRAVMEELIKQHGEEIIDSKKGVENAKEMVNKAIQDFLEFNNLNICGNGPKIFCIADFGCSTGPNTFFAVQNIIEAVRVKHPSSEFQVFFNDHPNNDFNTLFRRNLPSPREFFAAGVPGDFHTRLFPKASLHLGHRRKRDVTDRSVPEEVMDVNSPAWNEDSIYCTGYSEEVAKAYSTQFQKDMDNFLNARAQELVGGGLMALILPGLPDGLLYSQTHLGMCYDHLGSCLMDMAKLGLISQEKVMAFNLPVYHPTSKELEVLLERNSHFRVERIDYMRSNILATQSVQSITSFMRAIMEELIKQHFGEEILDSVFERFADKLSADYQHYVKQEMAVDTVPPKSWAMNGGDGPNSYAQNSFMQKSVVDSTKGMISEGIVEKLDFTNSNFVSSGSFVIADFGSSVGPNTFFAVANIIEAVEQTHHSQLPNAPPLDFQVFFNDVTDNDFNTLFKTLPSHPKYFAAGVPGTFYGRLFPKSFLHFAHSSTALHWLSKIPKEIVEPNSPSWNKGSIYCSGANKEVLIAYSNQFRRDMDSFLNARAEEIIGGGLMAITMPALPENVLMSQTITGSFYEFLGLCLDDMVNLGVISEEKADSFNLPVYFPSSKELQEIIKRNGAFSMERMGPLEKPIRKKLNAEATLLVFRAASEGVLKDHFGNEEIVEKVFENLAQKFSLASIFDGSRDETIVFRAGVKFSQQHQQTEANGEQDTVQPKSWAMNGGDGPNSYAQNSFLQKLAVDITKRMIGEGIAEKLDFTSSSFVSSGSFVIADFGSSVGPNTFFAAANIIEAVEQTHRSQLPNAPPLDFQVFFNDVTDNDFNTLFKTLPSNRKYFAAGVPGTFYGRLFPKSFLHFAHSSSALHWLSKIPKEIVDPNSPSWNKGSIYCSGTNKEVLLAYSNQFQRDMDSFLCARAQEIIGGGLMAIMIPALPEKVLMSQTSVGSFSEFLGLSLADMVKLGIIYEEKLDSFNLPVYFSSTKEMQGIIERNGCFSIERIGPVEKAPRRKVNAEAALLVFRATSEGVLKDHFGNEEIVEKVFQNLAQKFSLASIFEESRDQTVLLYALLKRNID